MSWWTERRRWFAGTIVAACVFRVALYYSGLVQPVFQTDDSYEYIYLAQSLLSHGVFGKLGVPEMNRLPGYPGFLAVVYACLGQSRLAVTGAQVLLDAVTAAFMVDLAFRTRMNRKGLVAVALLATTCVYLATQSYQVMTETFYTLVLAGSVWVLPVGGITSMLRRRSLWRLAVSGALGGLATLTRPSTAFYLALFPVVAGLLLLRVLGKKAICKQVLRGAVAYALAATLVVGPWLVRNRVVFSFEWQKPDHSNVTLLGYKTTIAVYRHWYTRQFMAFHRSYEEPFVMEGAYRMPSVARWVYPGEHDDVKKAFDDLNVEMETNPGPVAPAVLDEFQTIADKRYATAPRLYVTAPGSRVVRFWISPRITSFFPRLHGGKVSTRTTVEYTLYDCLYALPGLVGLFWLLGRARPGWAAMVAMLASQTIFYSFWHSIVQSRYGIPFFPYLALGCGVTLEYLTAPRQARVRSWLGVFRGPRRKRTRSQ
jgi:hypothetical protein